MQEPTLSVPTLLRSSAASSPSPGESFSSSRPVRPLTTLSVSSSLSSRREISSLTVETRTTPTLSDELTSSRRRACSLSVPVSLVVRRVPETVLPSCPVVPMPLGPTSRRSSVSSYQLVGDGQLTIPEKTAAQAEGEPCCDWVGQTGSGHYVKMVHNGIEYGDMQLIAEAYDILKRGLGLDEKEIADIFEKVSF
jgi:hypothetical protein